MIKRLRQKFVFSAMLTFTIVIGLIVGAINLSNYMSVLSAADDTLVVISTHEGRFPAEPNISIPGLDINITPETPYESRYFTVVFTGGDITSVDTASIAAINDEAAIKMARFALTLGAEKGFAGNYRYLLSRSGDESTIIYLDCTRWLDSAHTFLIISITMTALGLTLLFILLSAISHRVLKTTIEGYERQKQFITNAGHDLKTPLTIIDADTELAEMELGGSEWLDDIKKQTARLADLTNDLIYLAKAEEAETLPFVDFPISDTLEEVADSFTAVAKTRGLTIETSILPAVYYHGDEGSVKKMLTILIDNAMKYSTENGRVKISLSRLGKGVIIKISNPTENMSYKDVRNMFDRFYRSDKSRTGGGFGIGLSVARAIVDSHKGRIHAEKRDENLCITIIL